MALADLKTLGSLSPFLSLDRNSIGPEILDCSSKTTAKTSETVVSEDIKMNMPLRRRRRQKKRTRNRNVLKSEKVEASCVYNCTDESISLYNKKYPHKPILRPYNSPNAPENYNQFLMDEHATLGLSSNNYSPSFYDSDPAEEKVVERGVSESLLTDASSSERLAAFTDINFTYEPIDEYDLMFESSKEDFDKAYNEVRYRELSKLTNSELICGIKKLEEKTSRLEQNLESSCLKCTCGHKDNKFLDSFSDISSLLASNDFQRVKTNSSTCKLHEFTEKF